MVFLFLQCAKEHLQFCADATLTVLKKWRFCLESSKIQGVEDEADRATSGLVRTCHVIAQLFVSHAQMFMVWIFELFVNFTRRQQAHCHRISTACECFKRSAQAGN